LFDADAAARELLAGNSPAVQQVVKAFGRDVISPGTGGIDRAKLREIVFRDASKRKVLEEILHPLIRSRWMTLAEEFRGRAEWMLVDIPLLFETQAESQFDAVVVVACGAATQKARIVLERGLTEEMAERIIASQQSLASKISLASHVVWNESPLARLDEQAQILTDYLQRKF